MVIKIYKSFVLALLAILMTSPLTAMDSFLSRFKKWEEESRTGKRQVMMEWESRCENILSQINKKETAGDITCAPPLFSLLSLEQRFGIYHRVSQSLNGVSVLMSVSKFFQTDLRSYMGSRFSIFEFLPFPHFSDIMTIAAYNIKPLHDYHHKRATVMAIFPKNLAIVSESYDATRFMDTADDLFKGTKQLNINSTSTWSKSYIYHPDRDPDIYDVDYGNVEPADISDTRERYICKIPSDFAVKPVWDFIDVKKGDPTVDFESLFSQDHIIVYYGEDGKFHARLISLGQEFLKYKEISERQFDTFNSTEPVKRVDYAYFKETYGDVADWYAKSTCLNHPVPDYLHLLGCLQVWLTAEPKNTDAMKKKSIAHKWVADSGFVRQGRSTPLIGHNYPILTQTHLPKAFH